MMTISTDPSLHELRPNPPGKCQFHCSVCNVTLNSNLQFDQHCSGKNFCKWKIIKQKPYSRRLCRYFPFTFTHFLLQLCILPFELCRSRAQEEAPELRNPRERGAWPQIRLVLLQDLRHQLSDRPRPAEGTTC